MNKPARSVAFFLLVIFCVGEALAQAISGQPASADTLAQKLAAVPTEVVLADGKLRIVNLYKLEAAAIRSQSQNRAGAEIVDQLTREVYTLYASFWQGYLGAEPKFRRCAAASLLASVHPINTRLPAVLDPQLDALFTHSTEWLSKV